MALRIRRIGLDDTPSAQLSLEALARVLRPTIVSEVIDRCAAREKRAPKLPASAVLLLLCLAMNLYSSECLTHVLFRLAGRMRWLLADPNALRVSKGALCQARYRLGARPLVELFRRVCKPLATPATPGAFLFGLRLMALDGTLIDAPDTPGNVRAFGKRRAPRGQSAWPQVRVVAMSECATHAVCEAGVWPHDFDERVAGGRLLPRGVKGRDAPFVGPGVPQLRDGSGRPGFGPSWPAAPTFSGACHAKGAAGSHARRWHQAGPHKAASPSQRGGASSRGTNLGDGALGPLHLGGPDPVLAIGWSIA